MRRHEVDRLTSSIHGCHPRHRVRNDRDAPHVERCAGSNEMSGFDLQQRLAVPVIFITSHDDDSTRDRIKKSGAAGHLWKPFDEHAVLNAIRRAGGMDPRSDWHAS